MRCPQCGQEVTEDMTACPYCGAPLAATGPTVPLAYTPPLAGYPAEQRTSELAIASLVTGILGLTFCTGIGSIVALITGYMARKEIQESQERVGGGGLATAGLILGWIGVGLLVLGLCVGLITVVMAIIAASTSTPYHPF